MHLVCRIRHATNWCLTYACCRCRLLPPPPHTHRLGQPGAVGRPHPEGARAHAWPHRAQEAGQGGPAHGSCCAVAGGVACDRKGGWGPPFSISACDDDTWMRLVNLFGANCSRCFAAQADDFSGMGGMGGFGGGGGNSNPGSMQAGGDAPPMFPPLQFMNHERTAGLLDSAQQPQLPGRLLQVSHRRCQGLLLLGRLVAAASGVLGFCVTNRVPAAAPCRSLYCPCPRLDLQVQDIRPELQGRQAEMYWPDDNMWYLIEIHTVNVVNKTAIIVYRTGEVEELNLSEIANEGHMSLIEM